MTSTDPAAARRQPADLPDCLVGIDGGVAVREGRSVRPLIRADIIAPLVAVLASLAFLVMSGFDGQRVAATVGAAVMAAAYWLVGLPMVALWWRYRGAVAPLPALRATAGAELTVGMAMVLVSAVLAALAVRHDLSRGALQLDWHHLLPVAPLVPALGCGRYAGLLYRIVHQAGPPSRRAYALPDRGAGFRVESGAEGVRFPTVLPLALGAPICGAAWLAVVFGNLAYDSADHGLVATGTGIGAVALVAGAAWWPWLRACGTTGLRRGAVLAVGLTYLLGGVVSAVVAIGGLLMEPDPGGNLAGALLGAVGAGSMIAVPGVLLTAYARALR